MRAITLLSTATLIASVPRATAQYREWAASIDGLWSLQSNWLPNDVPDNPREFADIRAPGEYSVSIDQSVILGGLSITNPDATLNILAGNSLRIAMSAAEVTLNGTIVVNPTGENRPTEILNCNWPMNPYGSGALRLNAHPDDLDSARMVNICAVGAMQIAPGQRVTGTGRILGPCVNEGTLSPGGNESPIGVIEVLDHSWTQAQSAVLMIDVGGNEPNLHDRIVGNAPIELDGLLTVRLTGGFEPHPGDEFIILSGSSITGSFSHIEGAHPVGGLWRPIQRESSIVLTVTCATDLNRDGETSLADLAILLTNFGTPAAADQGDVNRNGQVDVQDLAILFASFGGGCR